MTENEPNIDVSFRQKATTAIKRSEKGTLCMVVTDSQYSLNGGVHEYTDPLDITGVDEANIALVEQAFLGGASKIIVIVVETAFSEAVETLNTIKFNWLVSNIAAGQADVVAYAKQRKCKTVVYNNAADDMHIVNFVTPAVVLNDGEDTEQDGIDYMIRIAGLLAGLPFTRSATYYVLPDLKSATEVEELEDGQFALINDNGDVRVARAVNSLTTLGTDKTPDMQKITIVEGMDVIREDITTEFKNNYIGKYKNKYDNQRLFISAVNGYYRQLAKEDILDSAYDNNCNVDTEEQRSVWVEQGGKTQAEVDAWTDIEVKKNTFRSNMYLLSNVKMLDAIEDMSFVVELF